MEHAPTWLTYGLMYLSAAVLAVPLAKALGLGSIIGYLAAGIAIGPWGLGLVARDTRLYTRRSTASHPPTALICVHCGHTGAGHVVRCVTPLWLGATDAKEQQAKWTP